MIPNRAMHHKMMSNSFLFMWSRGISLVLIECGGFCFFKYFSDLRRFRGLAWMDLMTDWTDKAWTPTHLISLKGTTEETLMENEKSQNVTNFNGNTEVLRKNMFKFMVIPVRYLNPIQVGMSQKVTSYHFSSLTCPNVGIRPWHTAVKFQGRT